MAEEEDQEFEHESYGLIGIHHIQFGGIKYGQSLFGSSIRHSEIIRISISHAKMVRGLSYDRFNNGRHIIEVDMSYSQFCEFITTHNQGTGIPCTIRRLNGEAKEDPPFQNKRDQHTDEFKAKTDKIAKNLDDLYTTVQGLLNKPSVTKAERVALLEQVRYARQCISSDLPFAVKQFDEQMDLSVKEAKGEIERFTLRRVLLAGQQALSVAPPEPSPILELEFGANDENLVSGY